MIIIMRFGKNVLCPKYINIYEFQGGIWGMCMVHRTLFVYSSKKMEKVQEHDLYLNLIQHHFDLIFFSRMNNKILQKGPPGSPSPISLQSEYSSSN